MVSLLCWLIKSCLIDLRKNQLVVQRTGQHCAMNGCYRVCLLPQPTVVALLGKVVFSFHVCNSVVGKGCQIQGNDHDVVFFPFLPLISVSGRFHFPHHDSRSLHYLSQATDPPDSVQMLQSHFEAWKVRKLTNS